MRTQDLEDRLKRLSSGDDSARDELIAMCEERVRMLARKIFRDQFARVRRWEETDDIYQQAIFKLHQSLSAIHPENAAKFYRLAALQIKRTFFDIARKHFGAMGVANKHHTDKSNSNLAIERATDPKSEPKSLDDWEYVVDAIERLPKSQQDVVNLIYFTGLTQTEAAETLHVTERTVRRLWVKAKLQLAQLLSGEE